MMRVSNELYEQIKARPVKVNIEFKTKGESLLVSLSDSGTIQLLVSALENVGRGLTKQESAQVDFLLQMFLIMHRQAVREGQ